MYQMNAISTVLLVISLTYYGRAQTTYEVNLGNLLIMQQGIGWPPELHVAQGHEALIKLRTNVTSQHSCDATTPSGLQFDVNHPTSNKYEKWSDGCGLRIRNVTKTDEGRWRLKAITGSDTLIGWSELHVEDLVSWYSGSPISLQDGQTNAQVELTTLSNSYCLVAQPFSESLLIPGHCRVTLDRTTRAVQGNWNVVLGIPGQISELHLERRVAVEAERLDTGYIRNTNTNKLHIYCNILHTAKNITFCRFQKTNEAVGYNIMDGLSDGVHSYYGEGFSKRHCGITIETPTPQTYGSWRCTVGVQQWVGNEIQPHNPMQALVRVDEYNFNSRIRRDLQHEENETRSIFVQENMNYTIMCRADVSLTYCWFQHPNGTQYTPVEQTGADQLFWYVGESLQSGDCGITFTYATEQDAGEWICHMGQRYQLGVELTDRVSVRVTGPLAAYKKEVSARRGGNVTLYCLTSNGNRPLVYCRFLSPSFLGISLDSTVTQDNAILNRFYFTPGRELQYGDCSMEISDVTEEDIGEWTCAALIDHETFESRDTISLNADSSVAPQFRADIAGMVGGAIILVAVLGVVIWYKRDKLFKQRSTSNPSTDNVSLKTLSEYSSSTTSGSSTNIETSDERQNP